jgi:SAM-dependent methyltransferase
MPKADRLTRGTRSIPPESEMMLEERAKRGLHASLLAQVEGLAVVSTRSRILDLACGTGAWLKRLHNVGYRDLWGIDRDGEGFGAGDIAHFISADLDNASDILARLDDRQFELVTMFEIIEHVADPERLVRLAYDALKPGGWLLVTSPNIYSLRSRVRFLLRQKLFYFESASHAPIELDHLHPLVIEAYQRRIFIPLGLSLTKIWTYPANGSNDTRWFARFATRVLQLTLRDDLPGDQLCLLFRKPEASTN